MYSHRITSRKLKPFGINGCGSSRKNCLRSAAAEARSPSISNGASPVVSNDCFSLSTSFALPEIRKSPSWVMPPLISMKLHKRVTMNGIIHGEPSGPVFEQLEEFEEEVPVDEVEEGNIEKDVDEFWQLSSTLFENEEEEEEA